VERKIFFSKIVDGTEQIDAVIVFTNFPEKGFFLRVDPVADRKPRKRNGQY
jgi:hypothetical protein